MAKAYYNENDPYCAQWLRNLMAAGHIAPGDVDDRSIEDVTAADLTGYAQCHFFAGIGVWSYALRLAGWPDDRPVWTGSCPCQPFSAAGKGAGFTDERHLWPAWHHLIRECRPRVVFGEQVASKDGLDWLDLVHADLEATGYACGAVDLCAAGVGAPHLRQRLYFVAHHHQQRLEGFGLRVQPRQPRLDNAEAGWSGEVGNVADTKRDPRVSRRPTIKSAESIGTPGAGAHAESGRRGVPSELGDSGGGGAGRNSGTVLGAETDRGVGGEVTRYLGHGAVDAGAACTMGHTVLANTAQERPCDAEFGEQRSTIGRRTVEQSGVGATSGNGGRDTAPGVIGPRDGGESTSTRHFWSRCDWLPCIDGKSRPVEPGTFPLVNGAPARVGRLRAYGNAIVAPQAQAFIESYVGATNA